MLRRPHETVATVLVDPSVLRELEMELAAHDLWLWPVATAPTVTDGPRLAFQIRHRMIEARQGAWDLAADWWATWIAFGPSWRNDPDPLPWAAHRCLWQTLGGYADHVRFRRRLEGVAPLTPPVEAA